MKCIKHIVFFVAIILMAASCQLKKSVSEQDPQTFVERLQVNGDTVDVYYELDENQKKKSEKQQQILERIIARVDKEWKDSIDTKVYALYLKRRKEFMQDYARDSGIADTMTLINLFPPPLPLKALKEQYKLSSILIPPDSKYVGVHFKLIYWVIQEGRRQFTVEFDGWKIINVY